MFIFIDKYRNVWYNTRCDVQSGMSQQTEHGELSEWSKVQHSKTSSQERNKNAEKPLTLRFFGITSLLKHLEF